MLRLNNKRSGKVAGGKAYSRDRVEPTPTYWNTDQPYPVIDKERPGPGFRHLLRRQDIFAFIELIPNWDELAKDLNAIVLARGESGLEGWYSEGVVSVCAWERDLWRRYPLHYYDENRGVFERLGVACERRGERVLCKFTESQARAFQLLNVLMHELGHHHDRINTRSKLECSRGEPYAEDYALRTEPLIWHRYQEVFGPVE